MHEGLISADGQAPALASAGGAGGSVSEIERQEERQRD